MTGLTLPLDHLHIHVGPVDIDAAGTVAIIVIGIILLNYLIGRGLRPIALPA
jgi:hypothetical protein